MDKTRLSPGVILRVYREDGVGALTKEQEVFIREFREKRGSPSPFDDVVNALDSQG